MPKAWSAKDERQYQHVEESEKKKGGRSAKRAKEIAARTVNKQRSEEGRTKKSNGSSRTTKSNASSSNASSSNASSSNASSSNGSRRSSTKSRSGGRALEDKTKDELYSRARKLHIDGRSKMNKQQLVRAIRKAA